MAYYPSSSSSTFITVIVVNGLSSHGNHFAFIIFIMWKSIFLWFFTSYLEGFLYIFAVDFTFYLIAENPCANGYEKSISYPLEMNFLHLAIPLGRYLVVVVHSIDS